MILGVTGTKNGATPQQRAIAASMIRHPVTQVIRHGDCVGFDAEAHDIAFQRGRVIHIHPPSDSKLRAFKGFGVDPLFVGQIIWHEPKPYLPRDDDIVDGSERLLAVPNGPERMRGSGTWYTIRYARGRIPITIVWPDGTTSHE
jgi:hypothetical protein